MFIAAVPADGVTAVAMLTVVRRAGDV